LKKWKLKKWRSTRSNRSKVGLSVILIPPSQPTDYPYFGGCNPGDVSHSPGALGGARSVHAIKARACAIGLPLKWFKPKAKGK
jgi:hypothetical protein